MEIKIIKNKENKWSFPCKGISIIHNRVVGFSSYGKGVILDNGNCAYGSLYEFSEHWIMNDFVPIKEEKQPIDWDKIELPIWAKDRGEQLIQITSIKGAEINYKTISNEIVGISDTFPTQGFAKQWLNTLEILPKGTKIEITI